MKLQQLTESLEVSNATKLNRFVKELTSKGFDAEIVRSLPKDVINSSKVGIRIRGYGMRDDVKLYKKFYNWEEDRGEFVDFKHHKKFSNVTEMVAALKEFYPRLPACFDYVSPEEKAAKKAAEKAAREAKLKAEKEAKALAKKKAAEAKKKAK